MKTTIDLSNNPDSFKKRTTPLSQLPSRNFSQASSPRYSQFDLSSLEDRVMKKFGPPKMKYSYANKMSPMNLYLQENTNES